MLRALERDRLITVGPGGADGRVRTARLTPAGQAERQLYDERSDDAARSILVPLTPSQRSRLTAAMAEVERLLTASAVQVAVTDPRDPGARFCIESYYRELARRFDDGFDPGRSISASDAELTPPAGLLLLATLHGEPVGCGALKLRDGGPADIKRMWVADSVRGLGLGRRLLAELEAQAAAREASVVRLETNSALAEAISLYRSAGYREVAPFSDEPYARHWFEKTLPGPGR
jgi:GNAT superfamily N-acetyltransferase